MKVYDQKEQHENDITFPKFFLMASTIPRSRAPPSNNFRHHHSPNPPLFPNSRTKARPIITINQRRKGDLGSINAHRIGPPLATRRIRTQLFIKTIGSLVSQTESLKCRLGKHIALRAHPRAKFTQEIVIHLQIDSASWHIQIFVAPALSDLSVSPDSNFRIR